MRAIVATRRGGPEVLELKEQPAPTAGPGDVLIRVAAAGVNFADLLSTQGTYARSPAVPFIPGLEVSGHEAQSNRPVLALVGLGGYAELVVADRRLVFSGEGLDLQAAGGFLLVTLTSYYALQEVGRLRAGETVLVLAGAGGLGSVTIQVARALGAGRVIAVASTAAKRDFALHQGADLALGYDDPLPRVDVVVDPVGGDAFRRTLDAVRPLGRMILLGMSSGRAPELPDFAELRRRNVGMFAFSFGAFRSSDPEHVQRTAPGIIDLIRQGKVRPAIGRVLPLGEAAVAHRLLAGRQTTGKVVLAVSQPP
jgi:NADPH2:quinone reductase